LNKLSKTLKRTVTLEAWTNSFGLKTLKEIEEAVSGVS